MALIIGLLGGEAAGKTTAAKYIEEKYDAARYALANPLKELVRLSFELTADQVYGTQEQKSTIDPRYNVSPRWLMRRIGTEGCQQVFGKDFWVQQVMAFITEDTPHIAVIEDVRFIREAELLQDYGAKIIKLVNRSRPRVSGHRSEEEWDLAPYDFVIQHDGTNLNTLLDEVDKVLVTWR